MRHRREILDKGYVELIDYMGNDDAPVDAARVSFAKRAGNYTKEQNDKLAEYLLDHNHETPFEMVTFKFRVKAPVIVWWHWVRHRMASYNFMSGRYVPFSEKEVYWPKEWRKQSKDNKQGSEGVFDSEYKIGDFVTDFDELLKHSFSVYYSWITQGMAREQARLALPFGACYYEAIVQMNARSLMNFIRLRGADDAQFEIREYAKAIQEIVSTTHPRIFK